MIEDAGQPTGPRRGRQAAREEGSREYAALDLGTNNCRLMIAVPSRSGGFRVVDSYSRIVRLGEGVQETGRLSEAAMQRALEALRACAARLGKRKLRQVRAVATEACRRTVNGAGFLERVRAETGLSVELITPREETELALEACASLLQRAPRRHDRGLMFDIGGGSTELGWARLERQGAATVGGAPDSGVSSPGALSPGLIGWHSFPLGVITLAEQFGSGMFEEGGYRAMVERVARELAEFDRLHRIGDAIGRGRVHLIGTSGTVTTLASVALDLPRYRRALIDGVLLDQQAAHAAIGQLRRAGRDGLVAHACVGPERAGYVLPGCAIFEAIHRTWPASSVTVADRGLRDGMLLRMMRASGLQPQRRRTASRPHRHAQYEPPGARTLSAQVAAHAPAELQA